MDSDAKIDTNTLTLKPNQELRRCSFQSGGGLVTVNFIGSSKKKSRLPATGNFSTNKYTGYVKPM